MPDTKPGLVLDKNGVCQACVHYKLRASVDYDKRFIELKWLTAMHRGGTDYDSIIAVSGGKDSHFQVHVMKEILGMNPLLVSVNDPFTKTKAGIHNLRNIRETFGCDMISLDLNPDLAKRMVRIAFEELGSPTWPIDRAIYTFPLRVAIEKNIPLIVYGENINYEYGGSQVKETYSAKDQIYNDVVKRVDNSLWLDRGIEEKELNMFKHPDIWQNGTSKVEPIYLSYFLPWDGHHNYKVAKKRGFRDLEGEWKREGYIENYDQIDSVGYLINVWMKWVKFGFARATDVAGYWIRSGKITKEGAARLIKENDYKLDHRILDDFLDFTGYTYREFLSIVEKWRVDYDIS